MSDTAPDEYIRERMPGETEWRTMSIREFLETAEQRLEALRQRAEAKFIRSLRARGVPEDDIAGAVEIGREIWDEDLPRQLQEALDFVSACRESALTPSGKPN